MVSDSSTATPSDVKAVLTGAAHYLAGLLAEGDSVTLEGIGTFRLTLSSEGVDEPERFTSSHIVGYHVVYTPDQSLLKEINKKIKYRNSGLRGGRQTCIFQVTDNRSGRSNKVMTLGGAVSMAGQMLKIDGDDPSVGLTLVSSTTNVEYPVPMYNILVNKAKEIIFTVPGDLPEGRYRIRLVTQYCESKKRKLKTPRRFVYEPELEVVNVSIPANL
jgi:nucleoid DNA-binding protein